MAGDAANSRATVYVGGERVELALRPMVDGDLAFVMSTWMRSYAGRVQGIVRKDVFHEHHRRLAERLIASERVTVACSPTSETTIHGWCCTGNASPVLHYAYVPPELRRVGLAREMIRSSLGAYPERIDASHRWPWPSQRFVFVPYLAGVAA